MITSKPFILTALLLFTATVKAKFGTLDIALYGTPTSTFWQHHYYHNSTDSVTHTGIDMQVGANTSHVEIDSYGFGQVVNINSGMGAVTIRHLIDTGEWINVNLLHLHSQSTLYSRGLIPTPALIRSALINNVQNTE